MILAMAIRNSLATCLLARTGQEMTAFWLPSSVSLTRGASRGQLRRWRHGTIAQIAVTRM